MLVEFVGLQATFGQLHGQRLFLRDARPQTGSFTVGRARPFARPLVFKPLFDIVQGGLVSGVHLPILFGPRCEPSYRLAIRICFRLNRLSALLRLRVPGGVIHVLGPTARSR
ncbi:hypothetical protein D3C71_1557090 [compost metagenome]